MLPDKVKLFTAIAVVLTVAQTTIADVIDFSNWELATTVDNVADRDSEASYVPQNPYRVTQSASLGQSTAMTVYNILWDDAQLNFAMDAAHQLTDTSTGHLAFSRSSGTFWFVTNSPVRISFDLEYDYNIPGSRFESYTGFSIGDQTNNIGLFSQSMDGGPLELESSIGTFNINGALDIPACTDVVMNYSMMIRTVGGNSGPIGHGGGHVDISITAIPEPATFCLLVAVSLCVIIRRRTDPKGRRIGAPGKC
ncbi:MAG: hypothetical protein H6818_22125 [Phycisphaerales bacterium]|nr:hypothetical protein [Phycisphaerales bacterium]